MFSRPIRYWLRTGALKSRIKKIERRKRESIDAHLEATDDKYKQLVESNKNLLANEKVYFKVTSTTPSLLSSFSTNFAGIVSSKGYAYCNTIKGNFFLNPFAEYLFPERIEGQIDHWGKFQLKTTKREFALFTTLPKDYNGTIGMDGRVRLNVNERETDILSGGRLMIDRLMANLFANNQRGLKQFQQNIAEMNNRISEFELA